MLRVPGLGVRNVDRILRIRRWHRLALADLTRLRVPLKKTLPFIIIADHTPHLLERNVVPAFPCRPVRQLDLFLRNHPSRTGELAISHDGADHFRADLLGLADKRARAFARESWRRGDLAWEELGDDQPALAIFEERENDGLRHQTSPHPRAKSIHRDRPPRRLPSRSAALGSALSHALAADSRRAALLEITVDPDVNELMRMDKAIRHDVHKMRAFVRFRAVPHEGQEWYVAWFEPEHHIVELNAPFFVDRFAGMRWSILTPDRCAHWDGEHLTFHRRRAASPKRRPKTPWRSSGEPITAHIFNPARVKTHAMQAEMPKRYWKNLPEASIIPALLKEAPARVQKWSPGAMPGRYATQIIGRRASGDP